MEIKEKNKTERCPICHKHCSLDNPGCKRGKEYASQNHVTSKDSQVTVRYEMDNEEKRTRNENVSGEQHETIHEMDMELFHAFQKYMHLLHNRKGGHQGKGRILSYILQNKETTQRKLQEFADVRSSSMSELLSKLEGEGYIIRKKSKEDKRNLDISLTEKGREAEHDHQKKHNKLVGDLFVGLDEEEKKQLFSLMNKLIGTIEKDIETKPMKHDTDEKGHGKCHRGDCGKKGHEGSHGKDYEGSHGKDHEGSHGKDHEGSHGKDHEGSHGKDHEGSHGKDHEGSHGKNHEGSHRKGHEESHGRDHEGSHERGMEHKHERKKMEVL